MVPPHRGDGARAVAMCRALPPLNACAGEILLEQMCHAQSQLAHVRIMADGDFRDGVDGHDRTSSTMNLAWRGRGAGKCSVVNSTSISATEIPVPLLDFPRPASPTNMNCESSISSIAVTRRRRPVTPEWTRRIHTCRRPRTALRDGRPPGSTAALRGGPVIASRRRCVRRTIWVPLRDNHVTAGGRPACRELPAPRSRPAAFRR